MATTKKKTRSQTPKLTNNLLGSIFRGLFKSGRDGPRSVAVAGDEMMEGALMIASRIYSNRPEKSWM